MDQIKLFAQHHKIASNGSKSHPELNPEAHAHFITQGAIAENAPEQCLSNVSGHYHLPSDSTPKDLPKGNNIGPQKDLHPNVLSSIIHNRKLEKEATTKCPSIDEQINKMGYIHTMERFLAIKRNEVLILVQDDEPQKALC